MIWIYGDSFACQPTDWQHLKTVHKRWPYLLKKYFSVDEKNFGFGGSSLQYSFHVMSKTFHSWQKNDIIIFLETSLDRKWWFKDFPGCSTINNINRNKSICKRDKDWTSRWFLDFYDEELEYLNLHAFYHLLNVWCMQQGVNCFALKCFNRSDIDSLSNVFISNGTALHEMSAKEYAIPPEDGIFDPRIGHFSFINHLEITRRFIKAIQGKTPVDTYTSLKEEIY